MPRLIGQWIVCLVVATSVLQADERHQHNLLEINTRTKRTYACDDKSASVGRLASRAPVKILIAVDSEGPTGVDEYWARNRKPEDPAAHRFRQLMTGDVNAAIQGCLAGGATEVYVKDDGFRDQNLLLERLDKRAKLLPAGTRLLQGLDHSFSGVMLVGFHAMEGAEDAVLAHTWSSRRRRRYWFNGVEGGEVVAYAIVAGHDHRVPIVLATGCTGLCREVRELLGAEVVTVPVKRLRGDGTVELFPAERTYKSIVSGAKRAVASLGRVEPYQVKFPLRIRLQLKDKQVTDGYEKWRRDNKRDWPGRRTDDNIIQAALATTKHIIL